MTAPLCEEAAASDRGRLLGATFVLCHLIDNNIPPSSTPKDRGRRHLGFTRR